MVFLLFIKFQKPFAKKRSTSKNFVIKANLKSSFKGLAIFNCF